MNADPSRAEALFLAAAEIAEPQERSAFLDRECGDDLALRARVDGLLASHDEAGDFLQPAAPSPEMEAEFARLKPEEAGERIGRYKLLQQIGEGGFGIVWMAEQEEPVRRRVALKIIKMGMDTKEVIARFEQERQALAMMDHPNIAKVFDAGATPFGRPYFVMELVRGIKITDYCDQAKLPTAERLQLFIAVCQAVQHAHQKGIIHRDLKPSNILVTLHDGVPVPKVIDFGVAKAIQARLTERTLFTAFEQMIGTPLYMSPEQAELSGLDIDTRSDIYSLGVLLYELLTGRTPVDRETLERAGLDEIRRIIREEEPPRPSMALQTMAAATRTAVAGHRHVEPPRLIGLLRGDLDWIVMKSLEKDRARRYETATALAEDLRRHLVFEPVIARPPSQLYRFRRMVKRNRLAFAAGTALVLALLMVLVILVSSNARILGEKDQKDAALREKGAALVAAQVSARSATDQLFLALLHRARAGRFSGQMGQRFESLQALTEAARIRFDERLRDEATVAMALPDLRPGPSWPLPREEVVDPTYSFSASSDATGVITLRSVPDRRELGRIESGRQTPNGGLVFSRDGRFLAQFAGETWKIWRWADAHYVLGEAPQGSWGIDFSPDSRQVAIGQGDHVLLFSLTTGEEVNRWQVRSTATALAFHPDNRRLAVGYNLSNVVSTYDAPSGRHLGDLPMGPVNARVLAWHPDGIRLAIGGTDPLIQIWNVDAKLRVASLAGHVNQITTLSFHPDGELLASSGWEGVCRIWNPSTGLQLMQSSAFQPCFFSTDGRWLGAIGVGESGRLLDAASTPEYRTIVSSLGVGQGECYEGDGSPDGRLLAFGMKDGVRVWDSSTWRELAFLPIGFTECVIFQPDGRELLTCGVGGVLRWPIQSNLEDPQEVRLGPATKLPLPFTPKRASLSQDGRTLAVVSEASGGVVIVDLPSASVKGALLRHPRACYVALSPDGRWVAASGWHSDRACLWNVATGALVKEWILGGQTRVIFTPDSRTLITCRSEQFDFWDVAAHKALRQLPSDLGGALRDVVFSPDGKLMAIALSSSVVQLQETASGRTVARLEDPHGDRITWMGFNADGTHLCTSSNYTKGFHDWDLRAIRARLKEMQLDWDWPEFPAYGGQNGRPSAPPPIRRIQVVLNPD